MAAPTLDELKGMVSTRTGVAASEVTLDSELEDLGLESKDYAEMLTEIKDKYGITVDESEAEGATRVGDLYRLLVAQSN
jgi:acyl carrier protein